jgi:hypothetical protein
VVVAGLTVLIILLVTGGGDYAGTYADPASPDEQLVLRADGTGEVLDVEDVIPLTWSAEGDVLTLRAETGEVIPLQIEGEGDQVTLVAPDGTRLTKVA